MTVIDRSALEESPLADLHAIASELSIDGFRRLRRPDLIDAILARQEGREAPEVAEEPPAPRRQRSRRGAQTKAATEEETAPEATAPSAEEARPAEEAGRAEEARPAEEVRPPEDVRPAEETVEGTVELLPNGSGFVRVHPPEPSEDDVYVSAAQVKRCELISGDEVSGPRRAPRRSERFASLVRVDTINGRPASEIADSARFEDLLAAFPSERFRLASDDDTLKAIEWLTPFGRGSRVVIAGAARAGKSEALRRLATALAAQEELHVSIVLAGVRPEEIPEWSGGPVPPVGAVAIGGSPDAQGQAVERAVDLARRVAARGSHAAVLIDTLDGVPPHVRRKALAAARNRVDGGSA